MTLRELHTLAQYNARHLIDRKRVYSAGCIASKIDMTQLKLFFWMIGIILFGLLFYGGNFLVAPGSLLGRYQFSCDWHDWRLTAQPLVISLVTYYGPLVPRKPITPKVIERGRFVQIGPMTISQYTM
ncbi:MAG: hypothetical protein ACRYFS_13160 [Janthinobacterium lividum]